MPAPDATLAAQPVQALTLFVEDLAACAEFYSRAFGAKSVFATEDSAVFKIGGLLVNLLLVSSAPELVEPAKVGDARTGVRAVYSLAVPDVDLVCEQLAAAGIALLNGPTDRPWGVRTASFADPAGHVWEICK